MRVRWQIEDQLIMVSELMREKIQLGGRRNRFRKYRCHAMRGMQCRGN